MMPTAIVRIDRCRSRPPAKSIAPACRASRDHLSHPRRVAPRNDIERRMAALFEEMLGEADQAHTDFFAAGGDSLSAIRAASASNQCSTPGSRCATCSRIRPWRD
jgi:hypothetical protein